MTAQSPSAYATSVVIHALILALAIAWAWVVQSSSQSTKIMELVAGEGDNYGAKEAPALGTAEGTASQEELAAQPPPAAPVEMQAVAAPVAAPKSEPKAPNFVRTIQRTADRAEARAMKKFEKEQKAKAEAEARAEAARKKAEAAKAPANRMSKEDFDKRYGKQLAANARAGAGSSTKISKIDAKGIAGGVVGGSTANTKGGAGGTAMTREDGDMLDLYFSLLIQRLKEAHERPTGVSDVLTAQAEFTISSDGELFSVRITRSSGNAEFDQSVLSAFRNVGSIGPRPDGGGALVRRVTFKMKDD